MTVTYTIPDRDLTPDEIAELEAAVRRPITYDEDSPNLTPETYAAFKRAVAARNRRILEKERVSS